jgi:hypothetical protein
MFELIRRSALSSDELKILLEKKPQIYKKYDESEADYTKRVWEFAKESDYILKDSIKGCGVHTPEKWNYDASLIMISSENEGCERTYHWLIEEIPNLIIAFV